MSEREQRYTRPPLREGEMLATVKALTAELGRAPSQAEVARAMMLTKQRVSVLVRKAGERGLVTFEPARIGGGVRVVE